MADFEGNSVGPYTVGALIEALSKFNPEARVMLAYDGATQTYQYTKEPTILHLVNPNDEGGIEWCRIEFSDRDVV